MVSGSVNLNRNVDLSVPIFCANFRVRLRLFEAFCEFPCCLFLLLFGLPFFRPTAACVDRHLRAAARPCLHGLCSGGLRNLHFAHRPAQIQSQLIFFLTLTATFFKTPHILFLPFYSKRWTPPTRSRPTHPKACLANHSTRYCSVSRRCRWATACRSLASGKCA